MTQTPMDAKQIARYLGALSIEERVQIIQCLLDAGDGGLQMLDIAARTELGPSAVYKQLESLADIELASLRMVDNNKFYVANTRLINELFDWMVRHYGAGFPANKVDVADSVATQEAS